MSDKDLRIIIKNRHDDFIYEKNRSKLNINFNRIAFIFFYFFFDFNSLFDTFITSWIKKR